MKKRLLIAVFTALVGSASLRATDRILVASSRSNSIEEFDTAGAWLRTFATTGPYKPVALAQSPLTGEIFATTIWGSGPSIGQLSNVILRYGHNGRFTVDWDTFTIQCGACVSSATQSLLFDRSGDLWVATAYGEDLGGPIYILKYLAADLALPHPLPQPSPIIKANMFRGNQMALNAAGNLCIAGFIDQDVQCFDTSTGALTHSYHTEIVSSAVPGIQPIGLAFDGSNRMYLTSVFGGQVVREVSPGGPIVLLAAVASSPNELNGNLTLRGPGLFTTVFRVPPPTFSFPDPVYEVSTGGAVTKFIYGTAAPGLGQDHIWGAYWMIFYCFDCAFLT